MEDEPVHAIRKTSRDVLIQNRRKQKDEEIDVHRSLTNLSLKQSNVTLIACKLKTKSLISSSDLKLLQNALVDDTKNIEVVLNTHGALRGLVRELSGHDVNKQSAASSCLCNLALGESKGCCIIAKAAGAYLVAALDSLTTQLAVTCAWTLGNLGGSGTKACDILIPQGTLAKLCDVTQGNSDVQEAAIYALTHVALMMKDDLRPEHLNKIVQSLSKAELNVESSQLLFIMSCHRDFTLDCLPDGYLHIIVDKLTVSIEHHLNVCNGTKDHNIAAFVKPNGSLTNSKHTIVNLNRRSKNGLENKCCELVYLLRVLANLNNEKVYSDLAIYFLSNSLVRTIRRLLEVDVNKSLLWLLGNMVNYCNSSDVFIKQLTCDL